MYRFNHIICPFHNCHPAVANGFGRAYYAALRSQGLGIRKSFRMGACIMRGNDIANGTWKCNQLKTHPYLAKFTKYPYLHAESAAILARGLDNCIDHDIYVARVNKNFQYALARPCPVCLSIICIASIFRCYYTIDNTSFGVITIIKTGLEENKITKNSYRGGTHE